MSHCHKCEHTPHITSTSLSSTSKSESELEQAVNKLVDQRLRESFTSHPPSKDITTREIVQKCFLFACQAALVVIGFIIDPSTFGISLAAGAIYSVAIFIFKDKIAKLFGNEAPEGGCSSGFVQKLTGVSFPKEIMMVCSTLLAVEHLLHHTHAIHLPFSFSLAFTGICIGAFVTFYVISTLKHGPCADAESKLSCTQLCRRQWSDIGSSHRSNLA